MDTFDTNGIPAFDAQANAGDLSGETVRNTLRQVSEPSQVTIASLIRGIFDAANSAVAVAIDIKNRIMFATIGNFASDTIGDADTSISCVTKPVAGQTGRSLEWEDATGPGSVGNDPAVYAAIQDLLAPVAPKYTAESLAQKICALLPAGEKYAVSVSQQDGTIQVSKCVGSAVLPSDPASGSHAAWVESVTGIDNNGIVISLSEPIVTGNNPLAFEGGAV